MRLLICLLSLIILSACGAAPAAAPTPPAAAPTIDAQGQALGDQLRPQLASELGVDPGSLNLLSVQAVRWRNSALGCPAPDAMYTQVVVDGYLLVFSDGSRTYELHSSGPGGPALLCDNGEPKQIGV
jgi:hypothetical protein